MCLHRSCAKLLENNFWHKHTECQCRISRMYAFRVCVHCVWVYIHGKLYVSHWQSKRRAATRIRNIKCNTDRKMKRQKTDIAWCMHVWACSQTQYIRIHQLPFFHVHFTCVFCCTTFNNIKTFAVFDNLLFVSPIFYRCLHLRLCFYISFVLLPLLLLLLLPSVWIN